MPTYRDLTLAVVLGDVDGDEDLDVVFGGPGLQTRLDLNFQRQLDSPSPFTIGGFYQLYVYSRYGPTGSVNAFTFASGGMASVPTIFGRLDLDLGLAVAIPSVGIGQPASVSVISIPVPNSPNLVGGMLYAQALVRPKSLASLRFTNVTTDKIR